MTYEELEAHHIRETTALRDVVKKYLEFRRRQNIPAFVSVEAPTKEEWAELDKEAYASLRAK